MNLKLTDSQKTGMRMRMENDNAIKGVPYNIETRKYTEYTLVRLHLSQTEKAANGEYGISYKGLMDIHPCVIGPFSSKEKAEKTIEKMKKGDKEKQYMGDDPLSHELYLHLSRS